MKGRGFNSHSVQIFGFLLNIGTKFFFQLTRLAKNRYLSSLEENYNRLSRLNSFVKKYNVRVIEQMQHVMCIVWGG